MKKELLKQIISVARCNSAVYGLISQIADEIDVDDMPDELKKYYEALLEAVDKFYRESNTWLDNNESKR